MIVTHCNISQAYKRIDELNNHRNLRIDETEEIKSLLCQVAFIHKQYCIPITTHFSSLLTKYKLWDKVNPKTETFFIEPSKNHKMTEQQKIFIEGMNDQIKNLASHYPGVAKQMQIAFDRVLKAFDKPEINIEQSNFMPDVNSKPLSETNLRQSGFIPMPPDIDAKETAEYWKKRCEIAEAFVIGASDLNTTFADEKEKFKVWRDFVNNNPAPGKIEQKNNQNAEAIFCGEDSEIFFRLYISDKIKFNKDKVLEYAQLAFPDFRIEPRQTIDTQQNLSASLLQAAKPLIKFLAEKCENNVTAIVDKTSIELLKGYEYEVTPEFLKD